VLDSQLLQDGLKGSFLDFLRWVAGHVGLLRAEEDPGVLRAVSKVHPTYASFRRSSLAVTIPW